MQYYEVSAKTGENISKMFYGIAETIEEDNNFTSFPIELDFRGLISDNRVSPYYALNAGYGIAIFKNGEPKNRKGGLSGQLEAGVSFAGRKTGNFHIGLGYLIQDLKATYTINRFGGDLRFIDVDTRIHRFILNFGWGF